MLTSAGYDGVLKRWDARGGTAAAGKGLVGEWKGHRGGGEGGGIMAFVQGAGEAVVTAGELNVQETLSDLVYTNISLTHTVPCARYRFLATTYNTTPKTRIKQV